MGLLDIVVTITQLQVQPSLIQVPWRSIRRVRGPINQLLFIVSVTNDYYLHSLGNVYIGDNLYVRKLTVSTGILTTVAGTGTHRYDYSGDGGQATAAALDGAYAIALDSSGG